MQSLSLDVLPEYDLSYHTLWSRIGHSGGDPFLNNFMSNFYNHEKVVKITSFPVQIF